LPFAAPGGAAGREPIGEGMGGGGGGAAIPAIVNVNRGWPINIGPIIITIRHGVIAV